MTTLVRQQRALQRAIVGSELDPALLHTLPGREPLLHVYRHAHATRLAAALRDNFGTLPQVMGDDAFDALAQAYVAAHPSRHPSIRWFGDRLPEFMAAHETLVPHPALVDLARMEWALRQAFDAADAAPIDASALAALPIEQWPALRFAMLPSVQLLPMRWAVEPVWRALKSIEPGEEPELPAPSEEPHALLVWRQGLETRWRSLDALHAELTRAALARRGFGELCALAADRVGAEAAAATAVAALHQWLADGLLSGAGVTP